MRRSRLITAALAVSLAACADGAPGPIETVTIAATPCDRPGARLGVGTVVAGGLVLTAAHVVEDDLRTVLVDGQPARVVALDPRIDAAMLALDDLTDHRATKLADIAVADSVRIVSPNGVIDTTVRRIVTLSVNDATDGVVHRRGALVLDGTVPEGTSGAPVVDDDDHIVGVVTVAHRGRDVTYATRSAELRTLIDSASRSGRDTDTSPGLAAPQPCA